MLTYEEMMSFKLEKGAMHYKSDQVEAYYSNAQALLRSLKDENEDLLKKMSVLADKIEEYRSDEENIRAALLGAQRMGDGIIKEARAKSDEILREADAKAKYLISEAQRNIAKEQLTLSEIQKEVSDFKTRILSLYKSHLEAISNIPDEGKDEIEDAYEDDGQQVMEAADAQSDAAATASAESQPVVRNVVSEEPKNNPQGFSFLADNAEEEDKQELKFGNLKFNENI